MLRFKLSFCVAKSRRRFYFLQHKKSLRKTVVIRATNHLDHESMKVREVIPPIGPISIVFSLKLFLNLLTDLVFPRRLTDSQSYVPIFTNHCVGIRSAVNIGKNRGI